MGWCIFSRQKRRASWREGGSNVWEGASTPTNHYKGISTAFYSPYDVTKESNHEMIHIWSCKQREPCFHLHSRVRDGHSSILKDGVTIQPFQHILPFSGRPFVAESIHIVRCLRHRRSFLHGTAAAALAGTAVLARRAGGGAWPSIPPSPKFSQAQVSLQTNETWKSKASILRSMDLFGSHPTPLEASSLRFQAPSTPNLGRAWKPWNGPGLQGGQLILVLTVRSAA